ncbi:vacuole protein [Spizellomyces punctatus DAOM BR117]|uniref:Vacuole protein n=1 Tax=Spizellomyces punctatus (strain DAOM BR117) TaxID=645134 RepID=A0A0L0H6Z2_SPIPD|nr:vacuole protein [Spizellomyces punctatus DAOM BR117]KNC97285.1 vacuole protein [Spizellomyces punctatus DAOM BR117]|eukprot:XP_016605325.1 vacuole protein [Spizellomyces punctatus DAOM BR117]
MSCCGAAKWKREHIEDHKFDLIDVEDFVDNSCFTQLEYIWVFVMTLKSVLVYMADLGVVLLLIITAVDKGLDKVSPQQLVGNENSTKESTLPLSNQVRFWLIMATVVLSYVLLVVEWKKAMAIVKSRDISYAFTNTVAYRYYVIRSYPHFCLFDKIEGSRKPIDRLAFWVFFTFRGWKRLFLADFPRQLLNFFLLFDVYKDTMNNPPPGGPRNNPPGFCLTDSNGAPSINTTSSGGLCNAPTDVNVFEAAGYLMINQPQKVPAAQIWLSTLTVAIWGISAIQLVAAFFIYVPLLFNIRGNLKEYCCHKVDKRIAEVLRKKSRKRAEQARKKELKEIAKYGKSSRPAPTLPSVDVDLISQPAEQYAYYEDNNYGRETAALYGPGSEYYPTGPGSAYGGSGYGPQPPLPNPYVRALVHPSGRATPPGVPDMRMVASPPPMSYDYDGQSNYGSQAGMRSAYGYQQPPPQRPRDSTVESDYSGFVAQYSDSGSNYGGGGSEYSQPPPRMPSDRYRRDDNGYR